MGEDPLAVLRALIDAAGAGDQYPLTELYADDYVDHADGGSREGGDKDGTLRAFRELRDAFPDTRHSIEDLVAEGDRVVLRLRAAGTHTGHFRGIAPTGRRVEMCTTAIYRVEGGRVRERWCDGAESVADALRERPDTPVLMLGDEGWRETAAGGRYREVALDVMSFTCFELEPGADFPAHAHPNAQITYVIDGTLTFELEGERHVLGPGEAIAIPGGIAHAVRAEGGPVRAVDAWTPPATHLD